MAVNYSSKERVINMKNLFILAMISILCFTVPIEASNKEKRDSDGTLVLQTYPLDNHTLRNAKLSQEKSYFCKEPLKSSISKNTTINGVVIGPTDPGAFASNLINDLSQESQEYSYYCGPATAAMILKSKQISKKQSDLVSNTDLQTEKWNGTPWYADDTNKYVMARTLNKYLGITYYCAEPVYKATCITWSKNVKTAYPDCKLSLMTSMVRTRGVIW